MSRKHVLMVRRDDALGRCDFTGCPAGRSRIGSDTWLYGGRGRHLGLGIAVVATMFTVTNAALVRPLPFERPHQLYDVSKTAGAGAHVWVSLPELQDWQSQNRTFSRLAGSTAFGFNLRGNPPIDTEYRPG